MKEIAENRRRSVAIVKRNYIGRLIVFTISLIPITLSLYEQQVSTYWYIYVFAGILLAPHIFYIIAHRSAHPEKTELRNMLIEGGFAGSLFVGLSFSLWPCLAYLIPASLYVGFYTGIKFYGKTLAAITAGALIVGLITGFQFNFHAGPYTSFASFATIFISTVGLVTSIKSTYERSRSKIRKNKEHLEQLASKLAKYLSPQVYSQIFLGKKEVRLESYRKKLTVFFSDIQGFTTLTDSMESEALSSLLNSYFNEMAKIALRHGGTIDKYMGDAIMIFFGDPESKGEKEDAVACVQMALEMRQRLDELRKEWEETGISKQLRIRMGVNTGYCTVGNFGSDDRLDYTIVGGQVNLASRLESNADVDEILISHETYALIKVKVNCLKREKILVKGIAYPVQTYQVMNMIEKTDTKHPLKQEEVGISISIDLEKTDKAQAMKTLQDMIKLIEPI